MFELKKAMRGACIGAFCFGIVVTLFAPWGMPVNFCVGVMAGAVMGYLFADIIEVYTSAPKAWKDAKTALRRGRMDFFAWFQIPHIFLFTWIIAAAASLYTGFTTGAYEDGVKDFGRLGFYPIGLLAFMFCSLMPVYIVYLLTLLGALTMGYKLEDGPKETPPYKIVRIRENSWIFESLWPQVTWRDEIIVLDSYSRCFEFVLRGLVVGPFFVFFSLLMGLAFLIAVIGYLVGLFLFYLCKEIHSSARLAAAIHGPLGGSMVYFTMRCWLMPTMTPDLAVLISSTMGVSSALLVFLTHTACSLTRGIRFKEL